MTSTKVYFVDRDSSGQVTGGIRIIDTSALPAGTVTLRARWSSLNYKDALAATGHAGVVHQFPHLPGIDVAGEVVAIEPGEATEDLSIGDKVLVTGYELGAGRWGGWSQVVRVPAEWVVRCPGGLSLRESMILGTAGFTAALGVAALIRQDISPDRGEVVVTGATGGVGCLAVMLLARLGYRVVAVSGKAHQHARLREWGAAEVVSREAVVDLGRKPLLPTRWSGAMDTVGGPTLATLVRQMKIGGCVAACGLVGGTELPLTVYPFILRGVTLAGIDSAWTARKLRETIWNKLAREWRLDGLDQIATQVPLDEVGSSVPRILAGELVGRTLIQID